MPEPKKPTITVTGSGSQQRATFTVETDRPLTREEALSIQQRAQYDPNKHGFFRLQNANGRATWSCLGKEACK